VRGEAAMSCAVAPVVVPPLPAMQGAGGAPELTPVQVAPESMMQVAPPAIRGAGPLDAVAGAGSVVGIEQLLPALQQLVTTLGMLVQQLQAQLGGASGGSACMHHPSMTGAAGAPDAQSMMMQSGAHATPFVAMQSHAQPMQQPVQEVDPATVKNKDSTNGLSAAALRGLEIANRFGLPLVSGKRGGNTKSDHFHGDAIDVGTLAIASPDSDEGTPAMKAYAEYMRQAGQAGQLNVKYIVLDGKIASARSNWAWRPYMPPGHSAETIARQSEGERNRLLHNDHVHVSFT
jgi:hypothetical protein